MDQHLFIDPDLSKEHMAAIGRVTVEWSLLETVVEKCLWDLLGLVGDRARAVTTHLNMPMRLQVLQAVTNNFDPAGKYGERLRKLIKEIQDGVGDHESLSIRRNRLVHAKWDSRGLLGLTGVTTATTYRARRKVTAETKLLSVADMLDVAMEIVGMAARLQAWHNSFVLALETCKNERRDSEPSRRRRVKSTEPQQ